MSSRTRRSERATDVRGGGSHLVRAALYDVVTSDDASIRCPVPSSAVMSTLGCVATSSAVGSRANAPARGRAGERNAPRERRVVLSAKASGADDDDDEVVRVEEATTTNRRRAATALAASMAILASSPPAFAVDRRTVVAREIKETDFENLDAFERSRSSARASSRFDDRGIPVALSSTSDGEDVDDASVSYTEPPRAVVARDDAKNEARERRRWASAAFQWSVIGAVAYSIRKAQRRSETVSKSLSKRFGYAGDATATALVGTRWRIFADIGREKGTWMPPAWGRSGMRLVCPVAVEFRENGVVEPIATGAFTPTKFSSGTWSLDGDTLRFNLMMNGMKRGDVEFGEEKLFFKTLAWGDRISANKGRLLVNQTRFVIRREWRSVGTFKAERIDDEETDAALVPPMRVRVPE